mgnify:CR=1 FL=1
MTRNAKRQCSLTILLAWFVSISVHLGIGVLAFFITWSVIRVEQAPPIIGTSIWHEQPNQDMARLPMANLTPMAPSAEVPLLVLPEKETRLNDGFAILNQINSSGEIPDFAKSNPTTEVHFMGLDAIAAGRIVYVVDASGSMLLHLSAVLEELKRSLLTLHPKQQFGVLFFQQDKSIIVPPRNRLVSANQDNIAASLRWIKTSGKVIPAGGSNPTNALKRAFSFKPDVVYLLSENITGAGRYEVSTEELLKSIDHLNPRDDANGARPVQINCIQYLTYDKTRTMERIAEIHGGIDGYTFIERGRVKK